MGPTSPAVVSVSPAVEEAPVKTNRKSSSAKGLLQRGLLWSINVSPSPALGAKEYSYTVPKLGPLTTRSQTSTTTHPSNAAELGKRLHISQPGMTDSCAPIYSFVSKSQQGYSWRVKNKIGKQLNKNKKLLAKVVAETPVVEVEGYSEVVLDAMDLAPTLGLSFGGDEKRLLNLFSDIEENWDCEEGSRFQILKGRGSSKIWNAPLIF